MKKLKEIKEKIIKRIKKSNIVRMLTYKSEIKNLNEKIEKLIKEKQDLIDEFNILTNTKKELEKETIRIPSLEQVINSADKSLKEKNKKIDELNNKNTELENELFKKNLELGQANIQIEEYKAQIEDLKSDRYLIRKIPSGRQKSTIKTKISKPMSNRVRNYMKSEHDY